VSSPEVARHYDRLDPFYRELWGEHLHHGLFDNGVRDPQAAAARLVSLVAERAGVRAGARICDVGCGYGATAGVFAREYAAHVTGLTLSRTQVEHGRARTEDLPGVELRQGDWLENGLPDRSFDAVVAIESLAHMEDKPAFFREAYRTLRPGGRLVVCAWLSAPNPSPGQVRRLLEPICREGRLAGMGTEAEYRRMSTAAGFQMDSVEDLTRRVRPTWSISARRVAWGFLSRSEYRRFLLRSREVDRVFALTVLRIWAAYAVGAMRYGLFSARRP